MLKDFNKYFTISSYLPASNASSSLPVPCLRPSLAAQPLLGLQTYQQEVSGKCLQ